MGVPYNPIDEFHRQLHRHSQSRPEGRQEKGRNFEDISREFAEGMEEDGTD